MFPPNLEHSNSTGRLDLFALYGPTVEYQSVDTSFCGDCIKIAKRQLELSIKVHKMEEANKNKTGNVSPKATLKEKPMSMRGDTKTI